MGSIRIVVGWSALAGLFSAACGQAAAPTPRTAEVEIRRALEQWPKDFAAGDEAAACDLFARDVRLTVPGQPDKGHDAECAQLARAMTSESPTYHYDAPRIEEVLVSGDLAVVRVVWTLHVSGPTPAEETVETENGVDVFRRQPDGAWRILLSHAFPEPR